MWNDFKWNAKKILHGLLRKYVKFFWKLVAV